MGDEFRVSAEYAVVGIQAAYKERRRSRESGNSGAPGLNVAMQRAVTTSGFR
jgi:hypothetical protein